MNILNDISKVYLESVAAKPDYLDFDKDGNKKESMKKALKDKEKVNEAVKGQDTEMRRAASAERQAERKERGGAAPKIPGKEGPSAGKSYADYQQVSIKAHDKATKGKFIHGMVKNESLDPVGQEDADIDNDGKSNTKSDKYLMNRRKVRGAAIKNEGFSNWRQDLSEVIDSLDDRKNDQQIKEKKVENKIEINPKLSEAIEELGGTLIEMVEIDEFDYVIESVYDELLEEGYEEDDIEEAIEYALTEAKVTFGHDTAKRREDGSMVGAVRRLAKQKLKSFAKKATHKASQAAVGAYAAKKSAERAAGDVVRKTKRTAEIMKKRAAEAPQKAKSGLKGAIKKSAQKVANRMSEELEVEEGYKPIDRKKESAMYRRAGNLARTSLSSRGKKKEEAQTKSAKIVSAITRQKEKERFDRIGQSPAHNEEFELDEKTLTSAETKKKEEIVKSMKKSAGDFEKRYPGRGKEVMYATATKMAKKVAEATDTQAIAAEKPTVQQQKKDLTQDPLRQKQLQTMKMMQQKELQLQRQKFALQKQGQLPVTKEETEVLDERRREDKGKPRGPEPSAAFKAVSKMMGSGRLGVEPRGKKKEPGKKPPVAGQYGAPASPAQKVAKIRAAKKRSQDNMSSRFD